MLVSSILGLAKKCFNDSLHGKVVTCGIQMTQQLYLQKVLLLYTFELVDSKPTSI